MNPGSPSIPLPPIVGFCNIGNTCFANTVFQCLLHTLPLSQYFLKNNYVQDAQLKNKELQHATEPRLGAPCMQLLQEYAKMLFVLWSQQPAKVTPKSLVMWCMRESIRRNKQNPGTTRFMIGQQHDMAEYLQFLFDVMHDTLGTKVEMEICGEAKDRRDQMMIESYKQFKQHYAKEHSIIIDLFVGQYYVQIQTCDNKMPSDHSESYDPFTMLTLALPLGVKACTLQQCFTLMREPEIIEGWKGERSNEPRLIEKRTFLWMPPKILIIHIKRFANRQIKNCCAVDIEPTLDLTDMCMGQNKPVVYELYAVGNHEGTLDYGHYFADCKTKTGQWHRFNDDNVTEISIEQLNPRSCYMLFYYRKPTS